MACEQLSAVAFPWRNKVDGWITYLESVEEEADMLEIAAVVALALIGVVAVLTYRRPKDYQHLLPVFIAITFCAATFFIGAYLGGKNVHLGLLPMIADEDVDSAAQLSGAGIPLLEIMVVCAVALFFFLALQLILQMVETNED
jgi:hypothetical protein